MRWRLWVAAAAALVGGLGISGPGWAATHQVGSFVALQASINAASAGDTIQIGADLVVTSSISLSKDLTIEGVGGRRLLTVPVPGVNEDGSNSATPSAFRLFSITAGSVTFRNLHMKGGSVGSGGAVNVSTNATARFELVTVSHSRGGGTGAGGGIYSTGTVYMTDSRLVRNSGYYGGGFVNRGGSMFIDRSTFAENRSEHYQGGGGAGESESGGLMFINNSTFSNNKSTENGGAIKNNASTLYVSNSTFTGNVAYGVHTHSRGGAIGMTGTGTVYLVNNLFAYNYRNPEASTSVDQSTPIQPSSYVLDDLHWHPSTDSMVHAYYNIFHDADALTPTAALKNVSSGRVIANVGSIFYTALQDGSNDAIFSGGALSRITHGDARELGTGKVYQPLLLSLEGAVLPSLKSSSWVLNASQGGARTAVNLVADSVALAHNFQGVGWTTLVGTLNPIDNYVVGTDQLGLPRTEDLVAQPAAYPVRGATGRQVDNVYQVKVVPSDPTKGQTDGGSVYGEVVTGGSQVTLTALPGAGQTFAGWVNENGQPACATPPCNQPQITLTVTDNVWIQPQFTPTSDGKVSVTFLSTGASAGEAPAVMRVTPGANWAVPGAGNLVRPGYLMDGWSTVANSQLSNYRSGDDRAVNDNVVLYPVWVVDATAQTAAATNITRNSATINGLVTAGVDATKGGLARVIGGHYSVASLGIVSVAAYGGSAKPSMALTDLSCKTQYGYAAWVLGAGGCRRAAVQPYGDVHDAALYPGL